MANAKGEVSYAAFRNSGHAVQRRLPEEEGFQSGDGTASTGGSFASISRYARYRRMARLDTLLLPAAPPDPNSRFPVLLYRGALPPDSDAMERAFAAAAWANAWRNGIYHFHHFHSNAHEVLGIAAGRVTVRFGGPAGEEATLCAGDVAVIPAGVAHFNAGDDGALLVVGAYPGGSRFDTLRGDLSGYADAARRAAAVPVPERGPAPGLDSLRQPWGASAL